MTLRSWHFSPRDPLVFDSGTRFGGPTSILPPQPSLVGCIRGAFFDAAPRPSGDRAAQALARRLLDIEVRGPWLQRRDAPELPALDRLLVPCPADLGRTGEQSPLTLIAARLHTLRDGEGVHLPGPGPTARHLLAVPAKAASGTAKVRDLGDYVLSLPHAIAYALDAAACTSTPASLTRLQVRRATLPEHRTHVSIKPDTLTADPEQLFVSRGRRLCEDLDLVADIKAPPDLTAPRNGLVFLGGESRPSRLMIHDGPAWPRFDAVREQYSAAIKRYTGRPLALRLALLTPGDFGDWQPPTLTGPHQEPLRLLAACHGRHLAISGWDLRKRRPRPVRRLVPAGATYLYEIPPDTDVLTLCEHFWGRPLRNEPTARGPDDTLAPVQNDGYALVLPGIRLLTPSPA